MSYYRKLCLQYPEYRNMSYYQYNRDEILERQKAYYWANRDERLAYQSDYEREKRYYLMYYHGSAYLAIKAHYNKMWYQNNRERKLAYQNEYYQRNKVKKAEHQKNYRLRNKIFNTFRK